MQRSVLSTIVRLAILSLIVGFALAFFGIDPRDLVTSLGTTVVSIYELVLRFVEWSVKYILIGAVVVVPIWLVFFLIRVARNRRGG
jgi:hypothetical protein